MATPNNKAEQTVWPAGLSRPAISALEAAGIAGMAALAQHTEKYVASLHGMGPKGIRILKQELAAQGLSFAPEKAEKRA
jgi:DNA-directed RNA polymerase alpha subunit